jgi:hypothetical protein
VAQQTRRTQTARPAPFTPEQIAALIGGNANQSEIAKVLAAHRQPRLPAPREAAGAKEPAPISLTAVELRELAIGRTPERAAELLEASVSQRRRSRGRARKSAARPKQRPPLY